MDKMGLFILSRGDMISFLSYFFYFSMEGGTNEFHELWVP